MDSPRKLSRLGLQALSIYTNGEREVRCKCNPPCVNLENCPYFQKHQGNGVDKMEETGAGGCPACDCDGDCQLAHPGEASRHKEVAVNTRDADMADSPPATVSEVHDWPAKTIWHKLGCSKNKNEAGDGIPSPRWSSLKAEDAPESEVSTPDSNSPTAHMSASNSCFNDVLRREFSLSGDLNAKWAN